MSAKCLGAINIYMQCADFWSSCYMHPVWNLLFRLFQSLTNMSSTSWQLILLNVCGHKLWKILAWNILTFKQLFSPKITLVSNHKLWAENFSARSPITIWEEVYYDYNITYILIFPLSVLDVLPNVRFARQIFAPFLMTQRHSPFLHFVHLGENLHKQPLYCQF